MGVFPLKGEGVNALRLFDFSVRSSLPEMPSGFRVARNGATRKLYNVWSGMAEGVILQAESAFADAAYDAADNVGYSQVRTVYK
jgi:hypothetical protein